MKISEFITRLEELKGVAGNVEVAVGTITDNYIMAGAEIVNVVERDGGWKSLQKNNTTQILVMW